MPHGRETRRGQSAGTGFSGGHSVGYVTGVQGLMRDTLLSDDPPIHALGAGASGLAAALTANRAGRRAIVHERSLGEGHRFHDDFQGLANWTTDGDVNDGLAALGSG